MTGRGKTTFPAWLFSSVPWAERKAGKAGRAWFPEQAGFNPSIPSIERERFGVAAPLERESPSVAHRRIRMRERLARIIPFPPARGDARVPEALLADEPIRPIPAMALEEANPDTGDFLSWLDDALIEARIRILRFQRALATQSSECARRGIHENELPRLERHGQQLLATIELLRLGQIGEDEARILHPGLRRSYACFRRLRDVILQNLPPSARAAVQAAEVGQVTSASDVERELRERGRFRRPHARGHSVGREEWSVDAIDALSAPTPEEARRQRIKRRMVDYRHVNIEQDLATWLDQLPYPWLEGIMRELGIGWIHDRWDREQSIREILLDPAKLAGHIQKLHPVERHIIRIVLKEGGFLRYDSLIVRFGGDEEDVWHWAEKAPSTPLERVRRAGLLYSGRTGLGRQTFRVAVIPPDLRPLLTALLLPLPARAPKR